MSKIVGGCLCGQVRYQSDAEPLMTAICHCKSCQKQTGTAYSALLGVPADALRVEGAPKVYQDQGLESGQPVYRSFCGNCGSPLFSDVDAFPGVRFLKAGTLDDASWLQPQVQFWCETEQPWVGDVNQIPRVPRNPPAQ
ncbi:MAG: GFA family protein [Panacagrimonas sp.]